MLNRIISGGQTGADRAGLDAAMASGFPAGGYCPEGRRAEDGVIAERYQLEEIKGGYRQRTRRNVAESDATLIVYSGMPEGGTALTIEFCLKLKKPFKLIDMELVSDHEAARALGAFLHDQGVSCLNVAGPRESGCPGVHAYVFRVVSRVLESLSDPAKSE